jgi:hypothetical protein
MNLTLNGKVCAIDADATCRCSIRREWWTAPAPGDESP